VVFIWANLAHNEVGRARAVFSDLAGDAAGAGAPGLTPAERLDRLDDGIQQARSAARGVRRYAAPLRATAGMWGWVPVWGGDVSQINGLLEYAEVLLDSGEALLASADAVVDATGGELTVDRLGAIAAALEGERDTLDEAAALLADAGRVHSGIDEAALSSATRSLIQTAESLRRDALLAAEVAAVVPSLLDAADAVVSIRQDAPSVRLTGEIVDLAGVRSALASLESQWPDIAETAARLGPKVGVEADEIAESALHVGRAVEALGALVEAADDAQSILAAGLPGTAEAAQALGASLSAMQAQAAVAHEALDAAGGAGPLSGLFHVAADRLRTAERLTGFVRGFLGYERPTIHLILGQDDEELRPSGGFLGAIWEIRFDGGRLSWQRFIDAYRVDRVLPTDQWLVAPAGFRLGFGANVLPFRDQNWWADFPRSADAIRATYELSERVRPDSVMAFTQATMEGLLAVTGPLRLEGSSGMRDEVDAATVRAFLREGEQPPGYASIWDENRYASYVVGRAMIDFFTGGGDVELQRLAAAVLGFLRAGDLLISAGDAESDAVFRTLGWDGGLPEPDGDGFYWVESNAYSPKISHLLRRSLDHRVRLGADGSATGEITVRYENPASPASPHCYQPSLPPHPPCYWVLFRLYLPAGAEVLGVPILPLPEGAIAAQTLAPGTDTATVARGADGEAAGAIEISGLGTVPAGGASEWRFRYRLPGAARLDDDGRWRYAWDATRQPGMRGAAYHLDVELPDGACPVGEGVHSSTPSFDLPDGRRMTVAVDYSVDPSVCGGR